MGKTTNFPENADDILESALNYGIKYSANKYSVAPQEVTKIVEWFINDNLISLLCPCKLSKKDNIAVFCFNCTGPVSRMKIK